MPKVHFFPNIPKDDAEIKYAVIVARYQDQWIFCRHKDRATWEIPGGHVEPGETALQAAYRELYEETGAVDADLSVVGCYRLTDHGLLCFAQVRQMGPIPAYSEIAECRLFDRIPKDLTYGAVHAQLFDWVQGWLNMQSGAGELWDIYDAQRNLTGRTHRRGDFLAPGDYHLVVHVWVQNSNGDFLLTKRSPNKGFPNMWEPTGGSALAGDDSLGAALREMKEETGLDLDPNAGACVISSRHCDHFSDVWLFRQDFDLQNVRLLEGETCDAMYASAAQIRRMLADGEFVPITHTELLLDIAAGETNG